MVGGGYYEMTKKFWNDWKRRFGETEQVYIARQKCRWHDYDNSLRYSHDLLDLGVGERILSCKFNGNTVELVIERKIYEGTSTFPYYHYNSKNECITLKRKDIVSLDFKKTK